MSPVTLKSLVFAVLACCAAEVSAQDASALYKRVKNSVVAIETDTGFGTGFFVGEGKYLLTAAHVVKSVRSVKLRQADIEVEAVVYFDSDADVAVLKLQKPAKQFLKLRLGNAPDPGTKVYVVGTPLGFLDRSMSDGIVSGVRKLESVSLVQFTASVSPGSSGSPVMDAAGRVVGLVRGNLPDGQSLNFAVSAADLNAALTKAKSATLTARPDTAAKGATGKVIGKLGQTIQPAGIYASADAHARVYYTTKKLQYIVVNPSSHDGWLTVLLQNGRNGYIIESLVLTLPYDVRVKEGSDQLGSRVATAAALYSDRPYKKGGMDLETGVDVPDFVRLVLAEVGQALPSTIADQSEVGTEIDRFEKLVPGDRLYFKDEESGDLVDTGIFLGFKDSSAYFIHASRKAGKVMIEDAALPEWRKVLVAARRS
ncbi:MAG: trypsin-like peptidase domain-containing protein [Armatimonadetes bacterium]|nr:trypsin-like peptidase domain-containing protein [Armatimonadota bacterium]